MWTKQTPRKAAQAAGLTRYRSGEPCPRGHLSERMVSTRACCSCVAEKMQAWRTANPDKVNAQKRAYCKANTEQVKAWKSAEQKRNRAAANARNQRYAETHREQLRAKNAAWAQANPGKCTAKAARRRASLLQATPSWADHDLMDSYYELASIYREHAQLEVEVDHVVPLQGKKVCGLHVHSNLQIIDSLTNKSKSNNFDVH